MKSYMLFLILYVVPIFKQNVYTYNMETSNWIIFIFLVGIVDIIVQMESKFIIEA
jgi:formate-dependent nitrite reductase membrane component NrfD